MARLRRLWEGVRRAMHRWACGPHNWEAVGELPVTLISRETVTIHRCRQCGIIRIMPDVEWTTSNEARRRRSGGSRASRGGNGVWD